MAKEWVVLAEEQLSSDDQIQRTFTTRYMGKYGHTLMSNRKLLFVEETGFFRKTYNVSLEIPYETINKVSIHQNLYLIVETEDKKYNFEIGTASAAEKYLKELMRSTTP